MIAFQFPTQLTSNGDLALPSHYRQSIPPGSQLQIVLLVEEPTGQKPAAADETLSLEEYTALLRSRPLPDSLITPPSGTPGEHLSNLSHETMQDFNETAWNQQWDQMETEMNAAEQADAQIRLKELLQDLR